MADLTEQALLDMMAAIDPSEYALRIVPTKMVVPPTLKEMFEKIMKPPVFPPAWKSQYESELAAARARHGD